MKILNVYLYKAKSTSGDKQIELSRPVDDEFDSNLESWIQKFINIYLCDEEWDKIG